MLTSCRSAIGMTSSMANGASSPSAASLSSASRMAFAAASGSAVGSAASLPPGAGGAGGTGTGGEGGAGGCCAWPSAASARVNRPVVRNFMTFDWLKFRFIVMCERVASGCVAWCWPVRESAWLQVWIRASPWRRRQVRWTAWLVQPDSPPARD